MITIVSDKHHIPNINGKTKLPMELKSGEYELFNEEQFIEAANGGEGLALECLYVDIAQINEIVYKALGPWKNSIELYYFIFDDEKMPTFLSREDSRDLLRCSHSNHTVKKEVDEIKLEPEPIHTDKTEELPKVDRIQEIIEEKLKDEPEIKETIVEKIEEPKVKEPEVIKEVIKEEVKPEVKQEIIDTPNSIDTRDIESLLFGGTKPKNKNHSAKVILFGSSKGGTGKTCTCLMSAYEYAVSHPYEKVAVADFDIIDGQVGSTIGINPGISKTFDDYYKLYKEGHKDFIALESCRTSAPHFPNNIDFYLACEFDIPEITKDNTFWKNVYELLIKNYDVVFFDSGIDYLGKTPITNLYKIADKIIITCNGSDIQALRSIVRQLFILSNKIKHPVFEKEPEDFIDKVRVVLTRVAGDDERTKLCRDYISNERYCNVPIEAKFGNLNDLMFELQWLHKWNAIFEHPDIVEKLKKITSIS